MRGDLASFSLVHERRLHCTYRPRIWHRFSHDACGTSLLLQPDPSATSYTHPHAILPPAARPLHIIIYPRGSHICFLPFDWDPEVASQFRSRSRSARLVSLGLWLAAMLLLHDVTWLMMRAHPPSDHNPRCDRPGPMCEISSKSNILLLK